MTFITRRTTVGSIAPSWFSTRHENAFGIELGQPQRLGDLKWQPYEELIRRIEGGDLPLDRPMITPVQLTRSPVLARVYPNNI